MKAILLLTVLLFSSLSFAKSFKLEANVSISGEYIEVDNKQAKKDGWKITKNEYDEEQYSLSVTVDESQLPYSIDLSDATLSISKEGQVSLGISVGDSDSSSRGSFTWPKSNGDFIVLDEPIVLEASGGDHASGSWSLDGTVNVSVVE